MSGLAAPVRVVRDRWGVPHIYAASQDDLFFAQGFVQAQDRLFQMDLWRRSSQGRLSEVLGANFIERDAMTRRMQFHGDMAAEWAAYGSDTRTIAEAFVRGINAWVDVVSERPPEEFALAGWRPERWQPADLLNRSDAFLASGNASDEVFRARLVAALGAPMADRITHAAFDARLEVPRALDVNAINYLIGEALNEVAAPPFFSGLAAIPSAQSDSRSTHADARLVATASRGPGRAEASIGTTFLSKRDTNSWNTSIGVTRIAGSNAWVVGPERSKTGAPILAVDPHRRLDHPSARYLVHLQAPGWNVIGAAAPWLPGVIIGHNDRVAWAMTSRAADVQDLYVEKLNPGNPRQVEQLGRWVDMKVIAEPIAVKGKAKPFPFERESTSHGVVIASDRARNLTFTVRWTGFEPGSAGELASLALDRAQSEADFHTALDRWKLPTATFIYATANGQIGMESAGWVPSRTNWNGALPAPGWTGRYEWESIRRDDSGPKRRETSQGYLVSANGNVPRTTRIEQLLSALPAPNVDDFARLQHDVLAWNAEQLIPLLGALRSDRPAVEEARQRLLAWDRRVTADSAAASLYVGWERHLLRRLAATRLDASLVGEFAARAAAVLVPSLTQPSRDWFAGNVRRSRDQLLLAALADTIETPRPNPADQPAVWGALHTALFRHPLAITSALRRRFNVGPFNRSGYAETVMSAGGEDMEQTAGATFSLIVDAGDWDRTIATNPPGQSEWPASAHFRDLAKPWAEGEYFPLSFSDEAVRANAEATLTLVPSQGK